MATTSTPWPPPPAHPFSPAVSTAWHSNDDDVYRAPLIDRSLLPTAPRAAREPNIDRSRLPKCPPYTAFLGNLPYDVTEDSIKDFFRGLNVSRMGGTVQGSQGGSGGVLWYSGSGRGRVACHGKGCYGAWKCPQCQNGVRVLEDHRIVGWLGWKSL